MFIPLGIVPEVGLQYARLFRELKLQETLMEFLLPQYEQAKIQEAKDTPTVQVLDKAVPPDLRAKPKRAIMVIMVGFISFIFCAIFVFTLEYYNRMKNDENENNTWNKIFNEIEKDISKILNIPVNTIKSHIHRAKKIIKKELLKEDIYFMNREVFSYG